MRRIDRFAPGQRVRRRRAVRRRAHLDRRARQLRAERPGLVLQHRRRTRPRRTSPAASARSSPSCRSSSFGYAVVPDPGRAGRRRLALLLVPGARRRRHEGDRRGAALRLRQRVPEPRLRHARRRRASRSAPAATRATGSPSQLSEYLNRTGSVIVILTLIFLAIIMSTQFSFGRFFGGAHRRPSAAASRGARRRSASGARSAGARSSGAR